MHAFQMSVNVQQITAVVGKFALTTQEATHVHAQQGTLDTDGHTCISPVGNFSFKTCQNLDCILSCEK